MEFKLDDKEGIKKMLEQRVQENLASQAEKKSSSSTQNQNTQTNASGTVNHSSSGFSLLIYIVLAIVLVGISFFAGTKISDKEVIVKEVAKESDIDLNNYITKELYIQKTEELTNTINEIRKALQEKNKKESSQQSPKQEVVVKQVVYTPTNETSNMPQSLKHKEPITEESDFYIFKCYTANVGSFQVPDGCLNTLSTFLEKYSNSPKYEVIGVVNDDDIDFLKSFIKNPEQTVNFLDFATMGLSRHRVVEATWKIKQTLGENTNVIPVNYTIYSKVSRGFVIRAYKVAI
ncbi:hypothetical protein [Arcobacter sp. FWKO B]|uniref:hypothetical protein n=1 Tax=Arcobacter sp. FWKO B TaxID=2593672 RepID=UPI0018A6A3C8|nr:hypothetical protein [Arcobacter sp. FWKO B]QOG12499.1 hypothetical protein FWKOB_07195 [Arcobacter sp. FWKO B]